MSPRPTAPVKVVCCQADVHVGDVAGNGARLEQEIRAAAGEGAGLIVLPELATTGYLLADEAEARALGEPLGGPSIARWSALAAELDVAVVGGYAELAGDGAVYNSAVYVDASGIRANYRKAHLWDREKEIFSAGDAPPPIVDASFGRVALMICYDVEFPEWCRIAALAGADLIAAPVAWPLMRQVADERPVEIVKMQAAAATHHIFVAVCDNVTAQRGQRWVGGSSIIDPEGYPLALARQGLPGRISATVCLVDARDKWITPHNDVFADMRHDLYRIVGPVTRVSN